MKKTKNEKRRLLLNKRLNQKITEKKRANFARPADSKLFVKGNSGEAVRTPLNKRLVAIILAIVMVAGLIPTGVFMLRPKAAGEGFGAVDMSVRVNGADDFASAVVPGGEISKTVQDAEYDITLPTNIVFQKAVVIDSEENTETEVFSAATLNNKTYYSLNQESSAGTVLDTDTQRLVLVLAEQHALTLNYNDAYGDVDTTATTVNGNTFVWGGEGLRVHGSPNTDYYVSSITYSIDGGSSVSATVTNNAAIIPANEITGPITVEVTFERISSYKIYEVEDMVNSTYYPNLDKENAETNFGDIADGPDDSSVPTKGIDNDGAIDPVSPGDNASFFLHSQSSSGGSHFELVALSINGVDIDYPTATNDVRSTTLRDGESKTEVLVELLDPDTRLAYLNDSNVKHRALYKIIVTNLHEDLEVTFYFKESTNHNIIIKGLKGIGATGYSVENNGPAWASGDRYYSLSQSATNVYSAAYSTNTNKPAANLAVYTVKAGYNPYTVEPRISYDNSELTLTGIRNNGEVGNPEYVIINAGNDSVFNDSYRYWGSYFSDEDSGSTRVTNYNYPRYEYIWGSYRDLMLTQLAATGDDWYAVALSQNSSNNQQLYINATPYKYHLKLDLGNGGSLSDDSSRFNQAGSILVEKDAHTVEDRQAYITLPSETPANTNKAVIFTGWKLVDSNGNAVQINGQDVVFENLESIPLEAGYLEYAYGRDTGSAEDEHQVLALQAGWEQLSSSDITTIEVNTWAEVPEGTSGAEPVVVADGDETVTKYYKQVKTHRETQPANRETVILNLQSPDHEEFYELNNDLSILSSRTERQTDLTVIPDDNVFDLYYNISYEDLTVTKQVLGNPAQLNQGFPITITITKPTGAPLDADEALETIGFSNDDKANATATETTITYTKTFGRSDTVTFSNVPHGWNVSVSEPKGEVNQTTGKLDYETTIVSDPEDVGSQIEEEEGFTGPTTWEGVLNADTSIKVVNKSDSYLILDKTIDRNNSGTYDLTLEAFATGDIEKETRVEKTPTDFVLVLDQSGSMAYGDMPKSYVRDNKTSWKISDIKEEGEDGATAYYYYDEATEKYYRVFKKHGVMYEYIAPNTKYVDDITGDVYGYFANDEVELANVTNPGGYSYRDPEDGMFYSLTASVYGYLIAPSDAQGFNLQDITGYRTYFYYYDKDGRKKYVQDSPDKHDSRGFFYVFREIFNRPLHFLGLSDQVDKPLFIRHSGYSQLCYKDENGIEHTLIDSTYCNSSGNAVGGTCERDQKAPGDETNTTEANWNGHLYRALETETRLQSLNTALKQFVASVSEQEDSFGKVHNRVAVVGFSSENTSGGNYNNTELLTGVTITHGAIGSMSTTPGTTSGYSLDGRSHNGQQYTPSADDAGNIASTIYANTLLDVADSNNIDNIIKDNDGIVTGGSGNLFAAIDAVTAYGGTKPAYGLKMAEQIFANRGNSSKYTKQSTGETANRNTVVIFFTDGRPGNNNTVDQYTEANAVVEAARNLKKQKDSDESSLNTKIYSIGVFGESDGNPLTYPYASVKGDRSYNQNTAKSNAANKTDYDFELNYARSDIEYVDYSYLGGYQYQKNYYFRDYIADAYGYPEQADDTIADYMRTVSSEYSEAKEFSYGTINDDETYMDMINRARGDRDNSERYYYMASDHDNLLAAFEKVSETLTEEVDASTTGMAANAILRDVINQNDFKLPEKESDVTVTVYTVLGSQTETQQAQSASEVTFVTDDETGEEIRVDVTDLVNLNWIKDSSGRLSALDVTGFDYSTNFIAFGKLPNEPDSSELNKGTAENFGKKLVVVISGLEPNESAVGELHSNTTDSGVYAIDETDESAPPQMINAFPVPEMYRYAYNLRETGVKTDDKFNIPFTRGGNGSDGIMVNYAGGSRSINNGYVWSEAKNGDVIYFETFDKDAFLKAEVPDTGLDKEQYDYHLSLIDANGTTAKDFNSVFDLPEDTSTIHVSNVSNTRTVIINEHTKGVEGEADYSSKNKQFPIQIKLTKADGVTLVDDEVTATITRKSDPDHPESLTLHFERGNGVEEVRLADGDSITFDTLKNYRLIVWEKEDDHENYLDSYVPDEDGETAGTGVIVIDDDNSKNVIDVINRLETNPDVESGFADSSNPSKALFIILAVIAILGGTGTGYILWKKKDEFVEQ